MVNLKNKYVRVTGTKDDKYVEFDFSIDDPEIFVELILPYEMFNTFCEKNQVTLLPAEVDSQEDYERMLWRIGKAGESVINK